MRQWIRFHLTYANVMVTILAFIVLGGGTAAAAFIVSSNSQIGPGTVSGHKPPSGKHANIISGSVNATDLANQAVTAAKIKAPEAWHNVGAGSTTQNLCADPSKTAVFCSFGVVAGAQPWSNYGGGFATAGFYKDQLGIVHLKGLVVPPTVVTGGIPFVWPIFRLPSAYRPTNQRVFPSVGRGSDGQEVATGRVDVNPNGLVVLESDCAGSQCSANGGYLTLEGVSFRRDG
jgi:hypothetical protein